MFGFLKRRERAEHLKLLRQVIEYAEELASFSERAAASGVGGLDAANDAMIFRSMIEDLTPLLRDIEADEAATLSHDDVEQLLNLWKDFGRRLDSIRAAQKAARARFER